jgi:hypothetical protein
MSPFPGSVNGMVHTFFRMDHTFFRMVRTKTKLSPEKDQVNFTALQNDLVVEMLMNLYVDKPEESGRMAKSRHSQDKDRVKIRSRI